MPACAGMTLNEVVMARLVQAIYIFAGGVEGWITRMKRVMTGRRALCALWS